MDSILRPKGRYQLIFVLMAALMLCSLVVGVGGSLLFDAFGLGGDGSGGNVTEVDASVEQAFRSTVAAAPDDFAANVALANYLANTGKLEEAIPFYETAVQLAPNDAGIRLDFARSLAKANFYSDAELQFRKAIELRPDDPQAYFYLGEMFFNMNPQRTNDAIDQYERTIEVDPRSFVAERSRERLVALGVATAVASPSPTS